MRITQEQQIIPIKFKVNSSKPQKSRSHWHLVENNLSALYLEKTASVVEGLESMTSKF
jgi:hypothetical protein